MTIPLVKGPQDVAGLIAHINKLINNVNAALSSQSNELITGSAITLSTINSSVIGGTTPAAASVTTLNASGTATMAAINASGVIIATDTVSITAPPTTRELYGKVNITFAGSVTPGAGTGSLAGVRGEVSIGATTTASDGFYYGTQGKAIMAAGSVMSQVSATRICGVLAQLDLSGVPTLTSGQISALWADWGATATTPVTAEANLIRGENTTAAVINSLFYLYGKSTYIFDLSDNSQGTIVIGTPPTTLSGSLKIHANGNVRYIPLYTNAS